MNEIFENLYDMTAFSNIIAEPQFLIMYAIAYFTRCFTKYFNTTPSSLLNEEG